MHKVKPKIPVFYVKDALHFLDNSWSIKKYSRLPTLPFPENSQSFGMMLGSMNISHEKASFNICFPLSNLGLLNTGEMSIM